MIVGIIQAKNMEEAFLQVKNAKGDCDIYEFRLDYLSEINKDELKHFKDQVKLPLIFTLRAEDQRGLYQHGESERLSILMQLSDLNPAYIDIEHTVSNEFIEALHDRNPKVNIIKSYHHFDETPSELNDILISLQHPDCTIYKIVTTANSSLDALRMLHFIKDNSSKVPLSAHCMDESGIPTRILGPIFGSVLQYVSLDEKQSPAPGCLSLQTFIDIYRVKSLNSATKIYAVLGDPISQSLGHIFHNKIFHESANNAVYVKFKVSSSELSDFFKACDDLPFKGFSITMPLKTDVLRFVDKIDHDHKKIGGLNTIRKDGNQISGTNTDGMGALNAIEKKAKVKSKKMLILGAGGAARAIASEAKSRQVAQVAIINRTLKKSVEIAEEMDFLSYDFDSINRSNFGEVDFIINTIPGNIENTDQILKIITPLMTAKTIVMDINYNQPKSVLNKAAIAQGCLIIDGYEMFVQQALMQQEYWGF